MTATSMPVVLYIVKKKTRTHALMRRGMGFCSPWAKVVAVRGRMQTQTWAYPAAEGCNTKALSPLAMPAQRSHTITD